MDARQHPTPHDALFKAVLSDTENAFALIRHALPAELIRALDASSLRLEPASFVDEELQGSHGDLLFSGKLLDGQEVLLYVLVEHQSTVDPLMPYRVVRYVVRVWESWLREHPDARRIPAVVPIVVHQGTAPWSGPKRLTDMIALPAELLERVKPLIPALELALHDLGRTTPDALATLAAPPMARLALVLMRSASSGEDLVSTFERFGALVRAGLTLARGRECIRPVLRYIVVVARPRDRRASAVRISRVVGPEAGDVTKTLNDLFNEYCKETGFFDGYPEWRATRAVVERQLRVKFGRLDEATRMRLEEASQADLDRWAERLLVAKTLSQVFARPRKPRSKK